MNPWLWPVVLGLYCLLSAGCGEGPPERPDKAAVAKPDEARKAADEKISPLRAELVSASELPDFQDDLDEGSLRTAIQRSLSFYDRISGDRLFALGDRQVSANALKASLEHFLRLLDSKAVNKRAIASDFDVFRVHLEGDGGPMLVTGYYEPVLEGRLSPEGRFRFPLYGIPPDRLIIDLELFDAVQFSGKKLVGRVEGNRVVPYYSRQEIDSLGKLSQYGCEVVWLDDPVAAFFVHVQGSGAIHLPDGRLFRVGYAGSNGRSYTSIGKYLIEKGAIDREAMSLQAIRDYLGGHPEEIEEVLSVNDSYVFFRPLETGPVGNIAVPLTAGRSVALDPSCYPKGCLGFLIGEKPVLDDAGRVLAWEPFSRWVVQQDTGGAIKGPGRLDLFCGTGREAEWQAGPMKQPGYLYILLRKSTTGSK